MRLGIRQQIYLGRGSGVPETARVGLGNRDGGVKMSHSRLRSAYQSPSLSAFMPGFNGRKALDCYKRRHSSERTAR